MSWTFLDSQNFLSQLLGDSNTSSEDMWPSTQRITELNNGELQFARDAKNLREYASGSVSSSQIAVPSDWLGTYALIIDGLYQLTGKGEISINQLDRYSSYSGIPPLYYFWEYSGTRYIKILGTASTYALYYWKRPTTVLVNNTDVSIHPEEYRKAPVYFACSELLKQIGKHQEAEIMFGHYTEYIQRAGIDIGKSFIEANYATPDLSGDVPPQSDVQGGGGWRW